MPLGTQKLPPRQAVAPWALRRQPIAAASAFGPPVAAHGYGGLAVAVGVAADAVAALVIAAAAASAASATVVNRPNRRDRIKAALTELPPTLRCVAYPDGTFSCANGRDL